MLTIAMDKTRKATDYVQVAISYPRMTVYENDDKMVVG